MRTNQSTFLPDDKLSTKIEELCTIFQTATDNLNMSKPKPMCEESIATLNKFIPNEAPRVQNKSSKHKDPTKEPTKEPTKTHNSDSHSPRVDQTLKSKVNQQLRNHRHPTGLKVAKAAQSFQLEEAQVKSNDPVTVQLPLEAINPPQQPSYRQLLKTKHKPIWERALCNELGRLSQGCKDVVGRNTFYFIAKDKVPRDKRVTYARLVCAIRPQKKETHRVRLTAGGNLVDYPGNTSAPTAGIVTIKTHWN